MLFACNIPCVHVHVHVLCRGICCPKAGHHHKSELRRLSSASRTQLASIAAAMGRGKRVAVEHPPTHSQTYTTRAGKKPTDVKPAKAAEPTTPSVSRGRAARAATHAREESASPSRPVHPSDAAAPTMHMRQSAAKAGSSATEQQEAYEPAAPKKKGRKRKALGEGAGEEAGE